jgi:hypothetical protein
MTPAANHLIWEMRENGRVQKVVGKWLEGRKRRRRMDG